MSGCAARTMPGLPGHLALVPLSPSTTSPDLNHCDHTVSYWSAWVSTAKTNFRQHTGRTVEGDNQAQEGSHQTSSTGPPTPRVSHLPAARVVPGQRGYRRGCTRQCDSARPLCRSRTERRPAQRCGRRPAVCSLGTRHLACRSAAGGFVPCSCGTICVAMKPAVHIHSPLWFGYVGVAARWWCVPLCLWRRVTTRRWNIWRCTFSGQMTRLSVDQGPQD